MRAMVFNAILMAAAMQAESFAGELRESLNSPVLATMTTPKASYDLEVCVADVLTQIGILTVYRDGPDNLVIAAGQNNLFTGSVRMTKVAVGTQLDVHVKRKSIDDRVITRLRGCL